MFFRVAADLVLVLHLALVLFVILGGLLALRWPRLAGVHVPVALYGATIELVGFVCPLTPLENSLRRAGGQADYAGGFIDHYVTATLYPQDTLESPLLPGFSCTVAQLSFSSRA